jgi:hypothetical protein
VSRRLVLPLVILAALAGCGGNDEGQFKEQYGRLNESLLRIGRDIDKGLESAAGKTNKQLSEQFAGFALRLDAVSKGLRRLDAPDDLEGKAATLTARIDGTVKDLKAISGATGEGDRQATAVAVLDFETSSRELNSAQNELARATGARVGPR